MQMTDMHSFPFINIFLILILTAMKQKLADTN